MEKFAVIVAAGTGTRMGADLPKQFLMLKGKPVLWHTVNAFANAYNDMRIILVLHQDYIFLGEKIKTEFPHQDISIVTGGDTRFHSVKNGLQLVDKNAIVFVHDAVRCLVSPQLIRECYETTVQKKNAIPAITASDTIRVETVEGNKQIDRNTVKIIQTPQTFFSDDIKAAFEQEFSSSFTDEAGVLEASGLKVHLVEGETTNIKITRPLDILIAEKILEERSKQ
jgi:2-C-methyl-D-erythritol 4-phosphate cytidylyltransferase